MIKIGMVGAGFVAGFHERSFTFGLWNKVSQVWAQEGENAHD